MVRCGVGSVLEQVALAVEKMEMVWVHEDKKVLGGVGDDQPTRYSHRMWMHWDGRPDQMSIHSTRSCVHCRLAWQACAGNQG